MISFGRTHTNKSGVPWRLIAWVAPVLWGTAGCSSCDCLGPTQVDTSPPTAGMILEYENMQGRRQTVRVNQDDSSVTVDGALGREIAVIYSAGDRQGVRSLNMEVTISTPPPDPNSFINPGVGISENLSLAPVTATCPTEALLKTYSISEDRVRDVRFRVVAENWGGDVRGSASVTVRLRRTGSARLPSHPAWSSTPAMWEGVSSGSECHL